MSSLVKRAIQHPELVWMRLGMMGFFNWMSSETYIRIYYRLAFGKKIDLENPQKYTEKINWCKIHWYNPLVEKCVDKYEVREYVEQKIGSQYLNDLYGMWEHFEDIDFDSLPSEFVLKVTNGSGDIYVCKDKSKMNLDEVLKKLNRFKHQNMYYANREWPYLKANHRYIAERLIHSSDGAAIKDYKIFCFHGEPQFCFVGSDRDTTVKFDFFDKEWNYIPVTNGHDHKKPMPTKPKHWKEMLEIARILSKDFPHVRVDLYEEEGRVYFGELTFFHFGGFVKFEPERYDYEFGKYFDLTRISESERR